MTNATDAGESPAIHRLRRFMQHGRAGLGILSFIFPGVLARWLGIEATHGVKLMTRLFASRDALMGIGQIMAERHGNDRVWYESAAAVDAADAMVFGLVAVTGRANRPRAFLTALFAAGAVAAGVVLVSSGTSFSGREGDSAPLTEA